MREKIMLQEESEALKFSAMTERLPANQVVAQIR